jgi:hypothetical protein
MGLDSALERGPPPQINLLLRGRRRRGVVVNGKLTIERRVVVVWEIECPNVLRNAVLSLVVVVVGSKVGHAPAPWKRLVVRITTKRRQV